MSEHKYHVRNPIKRHGESPRDHFTMIPNELARETALSPRAYQVAIVIRSHADDYEVSVKSLAEMLGWKRDTVSKAMDDLVAARWLAIRKYRTANGTRAFEEYHLNVSRKFTEEEATRYNQTVILHAHEPGTPLPDSWAPPCPTAGHPSARETDTKEYELEDQVQNTKGENPSQGETGPDPNCEYCDHSPVNVCGLHFHDYPYRYREPSQEGREDREDVPGRPKDAADSVGCWGCRTSGRDACSVHSPHLHPVSA